jgi:hypothetical protein
MVPTPVLEGNLSSQSNRQFPFQAVSQAPIPAAIERRSGERRGQTTGTLPGNDQGSQHDKTRAVGPLKSLGGSF